MNIFVCLPEEKYYSSGDKFNEILGSFGNGLKKYYGEIAVDIVGKKELSNVEVYVMGSPKYDGRDEDIKKIISNVIDRTIGNTNPIIKLNYSRFNPSFHPVNECTGEVQKDIANSNDGNKVKRSKSDKGTKSEEFDYEKLSMNYHAEEPRYSFDQVILPEYTRKQIEDAIGIIEVEHKVFDEWGLRSIIPEASTALSFYGPPGTGKSMSAEAVAHKLNKKILKATYADIESKFHGEGPKMVKAIFKAAERDNAVLFLDESDSLLSKRLTNVSDGSAQAINSMRSQLLISLEAFKGIVIFATNLVVNYDKAFLSRLINVEFTFPTESEREMIWKNHLKGDNIRIPLAEDVDITRIANDFVLCGREIKNTVKNACISVALAKRDIVTQNDLVIACENSVKEREKVYSAKDQTNMHDKPALDEKQQSVLKNAIQKQLDHANTTSVDKL